MARLNAIVGGLLRDLAESHTISDSKTVHIMEAYARDPVLAQLPVSRMGISEVQLVIKFVIRSVNDSDRSIDPTDLQEVWLDAIRSRVLPEVLRSLGHLDDTRLVAGLERRLTVPSSLARIDPEQLLDRTRARAIVDASAQFLNDVIATLPQTSRRLLEGSDFDKVLGAVLKAEVPAIQRAAETLKIAHEGAQTDVDVSITAAELAEAPENQVSELRIVARPDVLRQATASSGPIEEKD